MVRLLAPMLLHGHRHAVRAARPPRRHPRLHL